MVIEIGEKLHIIERRYFENDLRRHLVGEVIDFEGNAIRLRGKVWVFDELMGNFICKSETRERIIFSDSRLTINIIPGNVDLKDIQYKMTEGKGLVVTDNKSFSLDITELTVMR